MCSMTSSSALVAVCQMTSSNDKQANYDVCKDLITRAAKHNVKMVFLPECFDYISTSKQEAKSLYSTEDGEYIGRFRKLASKFNLWLCLGGFHEKGPENDTEDRVYNTQLLIDSNGKTAAKYRKLHLFHVDIPGKVTLRESDTMVSGSCLVPPIDTPVGKIGLATCYDVRFPELSVWLRERGAQMLTYPSAFTVNTGLAHWHTLIRARAIETQSYVCAPAQTGQHNSKHHSYGHAMVVDPWGEVIAACSEGTGFCLAQIDLSYLEKVRTNLPCHQHKRTDLYQIHSPVHTNSEVTSEPSVYAFGSHKIDAQVVFCRTALSYAFVNRKPVLPGHVLVAPIRPVAKLRDLGPAEISDMFSVVQVVQREIEDHHSVTSCTITIQDGPQAGQSVNHVHVHILPRREGDFEDNDEVYRQLANHDKNEDNSQFRSLEDMKSEANTYRKLFSTKCF